MRWLRLLGIVLVSLALLLVLAAVGLWFWAGTQSSLDWTLAHVAASQHIRAEGVTGSLRDGLKARRIAWEKEGLTVDATDAELAWQPLAIVRATLKIDHLHAAQLTIEDRRPPQPKVVPTRLTLPMRVEIDDVRIGQLRWRTPAQDVALAKIAGRYTFNAISHHVELAGLEWQNGAYSGEGTLNAGGTLALDAKLQGRVNAPVPGGQAPAPLSFEATAGGKLTDVELHARVLGVPQSPTAGSSLQATARLHPWESQPLVQADARFEQFDAGALWAQAPNTALSGRVQVQPAGTATWAISVDATNAQPGAWEDRKLPVASLQAAGEWRNEGVAVVRELHAATGGGELSASGEWRQAGTWAIDGQLANVDPGALSTRMAHLPVSGKARASGEGRAIGFDVDLAASGRPKDAQLAALELHSLRAKGRWNDGTLTLPTLDLRMADASLVANVEVAPAAKSGSGHAALDAPGLQLRVEGRIAERSGAGHLDLQAADLARGLQWLARWPGVPDTLVAQVAGGRAELHGSWQGGWADPAVQAKFAAPLLTLAGAQPWTVRDATGEVDGRLADARLQLHARAEQGERRVTVDAAGHGGRRAANGAWQGQLASLTTSVLDPSIGKGAWSLALQRAVDWRWAQGRFETGSGQALLRSPRAGDAPAQLEWEPVRFGGGELQTAGRLTGLPLSWVEFVAGPQFAGSAVTGNMVFDAQWDARLGETTRIRASLARSRGDVTVLAEDAEGHSVKVPAGVREARLAVESNGEAVTATLRWDSEHGGTADGRVATRLVRGGAAGWSWPDDAPLSGELHARLPRIGVWSLLAPPGWRLRGSLVADVNVAGSKADPQLTGTVAADDLALRSVVDGIEMQGGRLRAHLQGQRVVIDEFILHGSGANGGTVSAKGEGSLSASGPQATLTADLDKLRASIRSDRQVTVSGHVSAKRDASGTSVQGQLRIDQASIVLANQNAPKLGDDVVVRNAAAPITQREAKAAEDAAKPPQAKVQVAVDIDLGNDFHVQGMGVDTRLRGTVAIAGDSLAQPRIVGTIHAAGGEYRAYGQRLDIERGIIRFNGPPENPSLDVLAIRPNITQRVGVQVTGTALTPFVRLYSEPDLPDAEKLAWLVTGRPAPATGAESALVQQAALAFLAGRSGGGKQGIAATLGLDELSFSRQGSEGPSVTLGKRFGRNFYAAYERSLAGAIGTLYIFYDVTRRLTVRGQAGERTAVDLIYTFSFN